MNMSKYSPWISTAAIALLALSCFIPWTWHADLGVHFNGFYSERNFYGRPGKLLLILGGVTAFLSWVPKVWAKRTAILVAALNAAYAVKTYLVFTGCYLGVCPEKKYGIFLMLLSVTGLLWATLFPKGKLPITEQATEPGGSTPS